MTEFAIKDILPNPFRHIDRYPIKREKVDALRESLRATGFWGNVVARLGPAPGTAEIAYGHHRRAALLEEYGPDHKVHMIIQDLSDEQMVRIMARENLEDYRSDFLCMLGVWEAGVTFCSARKERTYQPIDIARILGWTRHTDDRAADKMNNTASACSAAYSMIKSGHLSRDDLRDMTVTTARPIVERAYARINELESFAKEHKRPYQEVDAAKKQIGKAVKETARKSREGEIAPKDLRGSVDSHTYIEGRKASRTTPMFEAVGKSLSDSIGYMLNGDAAEDKLKELCKALPTVESDNDKRVGLRLTFVLEELRDRTEKWIKRLARTMANHSLEGGLKEAPVVTLPENN